MMSSKVFFMNTFISKNSIIVVKVASLPATKTIKVLARVHDWLHFLVHSQYIYRESPGKTEHLIFLDIRIDGAEIIVGINS